MNYGHPGAAFKKFLWKHCYSHNKMSQAELFWGTKFHQNEAKKLRGYILSQESHKIFEKISPNFEKNN